MTSRIHYPLFRWEDEYEQLHVIKHILTRENKKVIINNNDNYTKMFSLTRKYMLEDWIKFIDYLESFTKSIKESIEISSERINNNFKFDDIKGSFSGHQRNKKINIRKFDSIEDLYFAYLESLHFLIVKVKQCSEFQITLLDNFEESFKDRKAAVNEESKFINGYTFPLENIYRADPKDMVLIGEELFNHLFIENATIFNGIDIDKILKAQQVQEKIYDTFYPVIMKNMSNLFIETSEYRRFNNYLLKNGFIENVILNNFIKEYDKFSKTGTFEKQNTISLYIDTILYNYEDPGKILVEILSLILLKSRVLIEALNNLFRLDALTLFNSEYNALSSVGNINIEDLRHVKDIIDTDKSIIQCNKQRLIFSKYKLGSVYMSSSVINEVYEKYVNTTYCTTLLYFISTYDVTLVSHGQIEKFDSFRDFISGYSKNDLKLFTELYKPEIDVCESIIGKKIDKMSDKDITILTNIFDDPKLMENTFKDLSLWMMMNKFKQTFTYRWFADPIKIPFIDKELNDVEMMIYILNKNKINKVSLQICNHGFIPNSRSISAYDNTIVWLSEHPIIQ